jgi:hypothetical protein
MTEDSPTSKNDPMRAPDPDALTDGDGGGDFDIVEEYAHSCRIVSETVEAIGGVRVKVCTDCYVRSTYVLDEVMTLIFSGASSLDL